jgi:predicted ester cyclase
MSLEQNKAKYLDAMKKYVSGDKEPFFNLLSDDHTYHLSGNIEVKGIEAYKKFDSLLSLTFPDKQYSITKLIAEGDWVMVLYTFRGTFKETFKNIAPAIKEITLPGVATYHFSNGKIVETWATPDMLSMMQQMGVVPPSSTEN